MRFESFYGALREPYAATLAVLFGVVKVGPDLACDLLVRLTCKVSPSRSMSSHLSYVFPSEAQEFADPQARRDSEYVESFETVGAGSLEDPPGLLGVVHLREPALWCPFHLPLSREDVRQEYPQRIVAGVGEEAGRGIDALTEQPEPDREQKHVAQQQ